MKTNTLKRVLVFLLVLAMNISLLDVAVFAASSSGEIPEAGIYWEFVNNDTLHIMGYSGSGSAMPDLSANDYPWQSYRRATGLVLENVTHIGTNAFDNFQISSVQISGVPVQSIGAKAFYKCTKLASFPFGEGLQSIGDNAFYQTALTSLTLPNSVTSVGANAFADCRSLAEVKLPSALGSIGARAFCNAAISSLVVPGAVTTWGEQAFNSCSRLVTLTLSDGLQSLGAGAFSNCGALANIYWPASLVSVGDGAFSSSDSIARIYYDGAAADFPGASDIGAEGYEVKNINEQPYATDSSCHWLSAPVGEGQPAFPHLREAAHSVYSAEYNWAASDNGFDCTASGDCLCGLQAAVTETVSGVPDVERSQESTGDVFTATFRNSAFTTKEYTAPDHAMRVRYENAEDLSACTAYYECLYCGKTDEQETAGYEVVSVAHGAAQSELVMELEATFSNPRFEKQTAGKTVNYGKLTLEGDGTEAKPYRISTLQEYLFVAGAVNTGVDDGAWATAYYELAADLVGKYAVDTPIGRSKAPFTGHFDGKGHTIELAMDLGSGIEAGLFGRTEGATVHDLTVTGFVKGEEFVGGIAGYALDGTVISDCINRAEVTAKTHVGGISGWTSEDVHIYDCLNTGTITGTDANSQTGGLCGACYGTELRGCFNSGAVRGGSASGSLIAWGNVDMIGVYTTAQGDLPLVGHISSVVNDENTGVYAADAADAAQKRYALNTAAESDYFWGMDVETNLPTLMAGTCSHGKTLTGDIQWSDDLLSVSAKLYCFDCGMLLAEETGTSDKAYTEATAAEDAYYTYTPKFTDIRFAVDPVKVILGGTATYWKGKGTAAQPYEIGTLTELEELAKRVNGGNTYEGISFVLTNDIGTEAEPFTSVIGSITNPFKGSFDGAGHTVRLGIDKGDTDCIGLFGCLCGATVKGVTVTGFVRGDSFTGGICGAAIFSDYDDDSSMSSIIGCVNRADVTGEDAVGGIAGQGYGVNILDCLNTGTVTAGNGLYTSGGITGSVQGAVLRGCFNGGTVGGGAMVGSLVGLPLVLSADGCYAAPMGELPLWGGSILSGEAENCGFFAPGDADALLKLDTINAAANTGFLWTLDSDTALPTVSAGSCAHGNARVAVTWSADHKSASAEMRCTLCGAVLQSETVQTTHEYNDATGKYVFTAPFKNEAFGHPTRTFDEECGYTWSEDDKTCVALRRCVGHEDVFTREVVTVTPVFTPASADTEACYTFTAVFADSVFETQTKTFAAEFSYTWSEDGKSCVALRRCAGHEDVFTRENATVTPDNTPATRTENAYTVYTATFTDPAFATQIKTVTEENSALVWYGEGTEAKPFELRTTDDLTLLAERVTDNWCGNNGFAGTYFVLTNDVGSEAEPFTSVIGDYEHFFSGVFDGAEHTVRLGIDQSGTTNVGLFARLCGATVCDLTVDGSVKGNGFVGGLCGGVNALYSKDNTRILAYPSILRCTNLAEITAADEYAGGLCGMAFETSFRSCANLGNITGTDFVGGLCGSSVNTEYSSCRNSGAVVGTGEYPYVGGIVGFSADSEYSFCRNSGAVCGAEDLGDGIVLIGHAEIYGGGIVGESQRDTLRACVNTGTVVGSMSSGGDGWSVVGGLIGYAIETSFLDCLNTGAVGACCGYIGGLVGCSFKGQFDGCFQNSEVACLFPPDTEDTYVGSLFGIGYPKIYCCYAVPQGDLPPWGFRGIGNDSGDYEDGYSAYAVNVGFFDPEGADALKKVDLLNTAADTGALWTLDPDTKLPTLSEGECAHGGDTAVCSVEWRADHESVSAELRCALCGALLLTETSTDITDSFTPATRTEDAFHTYTAKFKDERIRVEPAVVTEEDSVIVWLGEGTEAEPYEISDAADLERLARRVTKGRTYEGTYFVLTNDIGSEAEPFTSVIGDYEHFFSGVFDGAEHTVRLDIEMPTTNSIGLFGCLCGATVHDLTVDGSVKGSNYVGGICGEAYGLYAEDYTIIAHSSLLRCTNRADITGDDCFGGICGNASDASFLSCTNLGTVTATGGYPYVGGICGSSGNTEYSFCRNSGAVSGTDIYGGGIVGKSCSGVLLACVNTGTVTGDVSDEGSRSAAGGLVGYAVETSLLDCLNTGAVSAGCRYIGGLAGYSFKGELRGCFQKSAVTCLFPPDTKGACVGSLLGCGYPEMAGCYAVPQGDLPLWGVWGVNSINGDYEDGYSASAENCGFFTAGDKAALESLNAGADTVILWTLDAKGYPQQTVCDHAGGKTTVSYRWSKDHSVCTAERHCALCGGVLASETAVSSDDYTKPTLHEDGVHVYTAAFTDPAYEKQSITVIDEYSRLGWYGEGTEAEPYEIRDRGDLGALAVKVAQGEPYADTYFILKNDIGSEAEPYTRIIGEDECPFAGVFDGNGKTVLLDIRRGDWYYAGLFAALDEGAAVHDLTVGGSVRGGNTAYVGGIAGVNYGGITGCRSTASVTGGDSSSVGGIVGYNQEGTVTGCSSSGAVTGGDYTCIGGIVGDNYKGTVTGCSSSGTVTGGDGGGDDGGIGGIVGYNYAGTVTGCSSSGTVTGGDHACIGGIVGASMGTVTDCRSSGTVTGGDCAYIGGIAGGAVGSITRCDFSGTVTCSATPTGAYALSPLSDYEFSPCVGGVCGGMESGSLEDCSSSGTVSVGESCFAGGVCGMAMMSTLRDCVNRGAVTGEAYCILGGVCGETLYGTVIGCTNTGTVRGTGYTVLGGVCGAASMGNMTACLNSGTVIGVENYLDELDFNNEMLMDGMLGGLCAMSVNTPMSGCFNSGELVLRNTEADRETCLGSLVALGRTELEGCYTTEQQGVGLTDETVPFDLGEIVIHGGFYTPGDRNALGHMNEALEITPDYGWLLDARSGLPVLTSGKCKHENGKVSDYIWASDYTSCTAADICADCGMTLNSNEVTSVIREVTDREATCAQNGTMHYEATFVTHGTVKSGSVPVVAKGHSLRFERSTAPTCTVPGTNYYRCTVCGATVTASIPATGHSWPTDFTVTKEATCTEGGVKTHKCLNCAATETVTTPPLGHKVDAETGVCERCNQLITEPQTDPAKEFVPTTTVTEADGTQTVTENGGDVGKLEIPAGEQPLDMTQQGTEVGTFISNGSVWIIVGIAAVAAMAGAALVVKKKKVRK